MSIAREESAWIEMSQRERDRLKVLYGVVQGERPQKEAARLLRLSVRQVRRLVRRIESSGDQGLIHRLRGRPSNRALEKELRQKVLAEYQRCYPDFGPTLASEKLAEQGLVVSHDTLRRWLMEAGLWQKQRKLDKHRQRRARREADLARATPLQLGLHPGMCHYQLAVVENIMADQTIEKLYQFLAKRLSNVSRQGFDFGECLRQAMGNRDIEVRNRFGRREENITKFLAAYRQYCWTVSSLTDLKLAPFHLLATEGRVHCARSCLNAHPS